MALVFLVIILSTLVTLVGSSTAGAPTITVGLIATTFTTDQTGNLVSSPVGAQHLAAFMLAVDEINTSPEYHVKIRPEVSLGNVDYVQTIQNPSYDGAAAARDIFLSANPQAVIVADTTTKALSAASALQTLEIPTIFSAARSCALSHANNYPEVMRMTASLSHDGAILRYICRHFGWSRVAVINSEDDFGVDTFFVFKTQEMDGDTGEPIKILAQESFPANKKDISKEVAYLRASGATIFVALISKATSMALFLVHGHRAGVFHSGTQVLSACQESNAAVLAEVQKLLRPSESIDDVLKGLMSVQLYPQEHLTTARGKDFLSRYLALEPTLKYTANGRPSCTFAEANRTIEHSKYPLYKVPKYPDVCTGISSFTALSPLDPDILLTYDAVYALAKALHYLFSVAHYTNSSAHLNGHLFEILVTNTTNRLSIHGASGTLKWYEGYAKAENFGQGERTSGHSYKILNYFPASLLASTGVNTDGGLAFVGYFNGTTDFSTNKNKFIDVASETLSVTSGKLSVTSGNNRNAEDAIVFCVKVSLTLTLNPDLTLT